MYVTVIVLLFLDDIRITEGQTAVRLKNPKGKFSQLTHDIMDFSLILKTHTHTHETLRIKFAGIRTKALTSFVSPHTVCFLVNGLISLAQSRV